LPDKSVSVIAASVERDTSADLTMTEAKHRMAIFSGVAAVSAALGAIAAVTATAVASLVRFGSLLLPVNADYYLAASLTGAALGAVLGAAAALGPLRRAPLGRLAGWATVGTTLGVAAGFVTGGAGPILLGVIGFFAGALHVERQEWVAGRLPGVSRASDAPLRVRDRSSPS